MASKRDEINKLFEGAEAFIPSEILEPVRSYLFAVQPKYDHHEIYEDLVQVCLLKIWALERKFESMPPIYFVGVAHNTLVDGYREWARWSRLEAKLKESFDINEKQMMNDVLRQTYSKGDFDGLIRKVLTVQEGAVVSMKCDDLTFEQISVVLRVSPSTVKRRYSEALQKLCSYLRPVASERHGENV